MKNLDKNIKECEICKENATFLCLTCKNYLCDRCNKFIHDMKINSLHKIIKIDPFIQIEIKCPEHPDHPISLFYLDEKEISDANSLKKENISIKSSINEFNKISEEVINLKNKIEKEINNINQLYEKTIDELTKYYRYKYEKLLKEENDLKEDLQIKVTKIKENLENYLSLINNEIRLSERINKGILKIEKDNQENVINTLSYISKINKIKKQIRKLYEKEKKSLKFYFKKEENIIKYEEYNFIDNIDNMDNLESIILNNSGRKNEFIKKILEWCGYKKMELLFRGTRDGMNAKNFHNKCDNKGETITLIKNDKGYIFGGYASISWTSNPPSYYSAPDSFIFTLTNIYNIEPTKFLSKNDKHEVCHNGDYGPLFGLDCDIYISSDFIHGETKSTFPNSFQDSLGKGKSIFTGDINNNNNKFKIKEIEVFKLFK